MKILNILSNFVVNIVASIVAGFLVPLFALKDQQNRVLLVFIGLMIFVIWILTYWLIMALKKLNEFHQAGITVLKQDEHITTKEAIEDTNDEFRAMVFCGTKITAVDKFTELLKQGKVRMIVVKPNSKQSKLFSKARGSNVDSIGGLTEGNLRLISSIAPDSVRFYPDSYDQWFRVIIVDQRYMHVSSYSIGKTKEEIEFRIENKPNSLFKAFSELFEYLWRNGEHLDKNQGDFK